MAGQGTIISDGQGHYKKLVGNDWVDFTPNDPNMATGNKKTGGGKLSPQDQAFLNRLSEQAAGAGEINRRYDQATGDVSAMHTSPGRGRLMQYATTEEGGGLGDTAGALTIGMPLRVLGAITPKETDAFQNLQRLQSAQVLEKQLAQKGVQTEGDQARIKLTELSPMKSENVNQETIRQGRAANRRAIGQATFYTAWANKYGLHGTNPEGMTADQVWAQVSDAITDRVLGKAKTVREALAARRRAGAQAAPAPTIKVISRVKVK
jgi:hypothetical protein